jgi:ArsR family transcriptional regulator
MDEIERRVAAFQALADPLRLRLLERLNAQGQTCVCELVAALGTTQGNISTHLRVLRTAGLIRSQKLGKWVFYSLDAAGVADLADWLTQRLGPATAAADGAAGSLYALCCGTGAPLSRRAAAERLAGVGGPND